MRTITASIPMSIGLFLIMQVIADPMSLEQASKYAASGALLFVGGLCRYHRRTFARSAAAGALAGLAAVWLPGLLVDPSRYGFMWLFPFVLFGLSYRVGVSRGKA